MYIFVQYNLISFSSHKYRVFHALKAFLNHSVDFLSSMQFPYIDTGVMVL